MTVKSRVSSCLPNKVKSPSPPSRQSGRVSKSNNRALTREKKTEGTTGKKYDKNNELRVQGTRKTLTRGQNEAVHTHKSRKNTKGHMPSRRLRAMKKGRGQGAIASAQQTARAAAQEARAQTPPAPILPPVSSGPRPPKPHRRAQPLNTIPVLPTGAGDVFVWGSNEMTQLGLGDNVSGWKTRPLPLNALNGKGIVNVIAGSMHCIALGTLDEKGLAANNVWSWGVNDHSALGRPTDMDTGEEEGVPAMVPGLEGINVVDLAVSDNMSAVLTDHGKLYAWGTFRSMEGVIGFAPGIEVQSTPMKIAYLDQENIVSVSCGYNHVLALTEYGDVWAWGDSSMHQTGRRILERRLENQLLPERLGIKNIRLIAAGGYHSIAVDKNGHIWVWGLNNFSQCGFPVSDENIHIFPPRRLNSLSHLGPIRKIVGGCHHTLVLFANGDIYSFGRCDSGELGVSEETIAMQAAQDDPDHIRSSQRSVSTPLKVHIPWQGLCVDIAAGMSHNLALTDRGECYAWGFGETGQLGNGEERIIYTPVQVSIMGNEITKITAGAQHSAALAKVWRESSA